MEQMREYRDDIQLLPNPLHLDRYSYRLRENVSPKLVWIRSFHKTYNPTLAPALIANLATDFPDIELTMVGPDKGDGSLQATRKKASELGVLNRIRFTGGVPKTDVPKYLEQADVFISTTDIDNTPVTVLEAMACGLCVVSTNVGGVPYLVADGVNALLVPPRDCEAMSNAVGRILKEGDLGRSLSMNSGTFVQQFDWVEILPRWNRLIDDVSAAKS